MLDRAAAIATGIGAARGGEADSEGAAGVDAAAAAAVVADIGRVAEGSLAVGAAAEEEEGRDDFAP